MAVGTLSCQGPRADRRARAGRGGHVWGRPPGNPRADRRDEALHERGTAIVQELRQRSTSRPAPGEQPPAGALVVLRPSGADEAVAADPHAGRVSDGAEGEDGGQGLVRTRRVAQDRLERGPGGGPNPDRVERAAH